MNCQILVALRAINTTNNKIAIGTTISAPTGEPVLFIAKNEIIARMRRNALSSNKAMMDDDELKCEA
jgi:hypothetical protein